MTIIPEKIELVENFCIVFDEIKVARRGKVFDLSSPYLNKEQHLFTGGAGACADYLNKYFCLDNWNLNSILEGKHE